jgi:hypothetical protein
VTDADAPRTTDTPNMTKQDTRAMLKASGWQHFKGNLDYCPKCVANGNARKRVQDMNS